MELDQFKNVDLVIDKANDNFIQRQFVSQGDLNGRSLTVQVTNDGVIGQTPGLALNLHWQNLASGLTDLTAFSVLDAKVNLFEIEYPQHMLTPGKVIAYVQVLHNGKVTHLKPFEITVQRLAGQVKGVLQTAEYSALVNTLAKANSFESDIKKIELEKATKNEVINAINDRVDNITQGAPANTYANLSALQAAYPNGYDKPMLVLESDGVTGYVYTWSGGAWRKGVLYQAQGVADNSITVDKTDFLQVDKNYNLFDGRYVRAALTGETAVFNTSTSTGYCAVLKIEGGKTYYINKSVSDRFRIGMFNVAPYNQKRVDRYVTSGFLDNQTYTEITTQSNEQYLVVYVSNNSQTPDLSVSTRQHVGILPMSITSKIALIPKDTDGESFVKKENNFEIIAAGITGETGTSNGFNANENARSYIFKVEPNQVYAIRKSASSRFRVATSVDYPEVGAGVSMLIGPGVSRDNLLETAIKIPENHQYLIVYCAVNEPLPVVNLKKGTSIKRLLTGENSLNNAVTTYNFDDVVGDANFISNQYSLFSDVLMTVPATDDTEALQKLFDGSGTAIELEPRKYLVTAPLKIWADKVRLLKGNGATIVTTGDFDALRVFGTLKTSAAPEDTQEISFSESHFIIENLRFYSASKNGTALVLDKTFGVALNNVSTLYYKNALKVINHNRNIIINACHFYANADYGIWLTSTCDLHQLIVNACHISYSRVNIFIDNCNLLNSQFTGCDIETSNYPTSTISDKRNIAIVLGAGKTVGDIKFVGCTIEDHQTSDTAIVVDGDVVDLLVSDCVIGNNIGDGIRIKATGAFTFANNSFKGSDGYFVVLDGNAYRMQLVNNTTGRLLRASTSVNVERSNVSGNITSKAAEPSIDLSSINLKDSFVINNFATVVNPQNTTNNLIKDNL